MGLFSFIKEAGEKLFGGKPAQAATAAAPSAEALNTQAAQAITTYIQAQNLGLEDLQVTFDGSEGKVTVRGAAPTQAAKEKVTLCCGNVASVQSVDNEMTVTHPEPECTESLDGALLRRHGHARRDDALRRPRHDPPARTVRCA